MSIRHDLQSPLSEICDIGGGVEYAAQLVGVAANVSVIKFQKDLKPEFDINDRSIEQAVKKYGAEAALKYVYDWAVDEIIRQEEIRDGESESGDEYDDELYCELNIFTDTLELAGEFEVEEQDDER